jgi:hypothetical protein
MYIKAETAPILSGLILAVARYKDEDYSRGRFGLERSFPENPALINAFFKAGIKSTVKTNAATEKPTEA